jgi:hypothetical protein
MVPIVKDDGAGKGDAGEHRAPYRLGTGHDGRRHGDRNACKQHAEAGREHGICRNEAGRNRPTGSAGPGSVRSKLIHYRTVGP